MDKIIGQFVGEDIGAMTNTFRYDVFVFERSQEAVGDPRFAAGYRYLRLEDGTPVYPLGDGQFYFENGDEEEATVMVSEDPLALSFKDWADRYSS